MTEHDPYLVTPPIHPCLECGCVECECDVSFGDLRAELAAAREALDPFARVGAILKPLNLDPKRPLWDAMPRSWPTVGDVERARAALEHAEKEEG